MRFKELLPLLATLYRREEFDAKMLSLESLKISSYMTIKEASNELRRLYLMGFLKRRRVKRRCTSKKGKTCYKGYMYKYSISNQGISYIQYLANPEEHKSESEQIYMLKRLIEIKYEEPERSDLLALTNILSAFDEENGSLRFPRRISPTAKRQIDSIIEWMKRSKEEKEKRKQLQKRISDENII